MIIEIAGGTYPAAGWWFILIPVGIIAVGIAVTALGEWELGYPIAAVGVAATLMYALLFAFVVAPDHSELGERAQKTQALEEQGFENVDVDDDDDSFTASRDGDYFSGSLLEIAENTYQVVEKVEVQ